MMTSGTDFLVIFSIQKSTSEWNVNMNGVKDSKKNLIQFLYWYTYLGIEIDH